MPETKDEKQIQPRPPAAEASKPSKGERFRLFAQIWVLLMGISWAGGAAVLLSQLHFLGSATIGLGKKSLIDPSPSIFLSPAGLGIGLALGVAIIFLVLTKLRDRMTYSRPGLGRAVRASAYGGIGAMVLFGAYALYMAPPFSSVWWVDVFPPGSLFGKVISLKPILFPTVALFTVLMSGIFLLLNQEKWADFLIETEGEIKKVSWPARKEYVGSAMVVVLVIAIVSLFLHFVDKGLSSVMQQLGVGF